MIPSNNYWVVLRDKNGSEFRLPVVAWSDEGQALVADDDVLGPLGPSDDIVRMEYRPPIVAVVERGAYVIGVRADGSTTVVLGPSEEKDEARS